MRHDELINEIERREYYNKFAPFPVYDTEIINDLKKLNMITSKDIRQGGGLLLRLWKHRHRLCPHI